MLDRALPRSLACSLLAAALACTAAPERAADGSKPEAEAKTEAAPAPSPAPTTGETGSPAETDNPYAELGMPAPAAAWTLGEYEAARKAIAAIAKRDPSTLPRAGSPTFDTLAQVEHLDKLAAGLAPERLAGLSLGLGMIHQVYGDQRRRDPSFERERVILTAAVLAVTTKLPVNAARDEAEAAALRDDPRRLQGLLRLRHGIHELAAELLGFTPASDLPYGFACEQLARVIAGTAPLLLPEEREAAAAKLDRCAAEGADAEAVTKLREALAESAPSVALVTTLLAEHRELAAAEAKKSSAEPEPAPG